MMTTITQESSTLLTSSTATGSRHFMHTLQKTGWLNHE